MRETNTSMTEYLGFYNTAWDDLMAYEARPESTLREYGNRSVCTTWAISFEDVKKKNEDAAKMLQVWSYLDNRDIWFEIFNNETNPELEYWSDPPEWFRRVVRDKLSFKGVAATLLAYSLIEARQDSESYGVHPVVHEWCRNTIITNRKPEPAFLAITSVAFGVPYHYQRNARSTWRRLLQHANRFSQRLMDKLEEAFDSEQANELHLAFNRLGRLYQDGGPRMWVEAEATYCRALSGHTKLVGLHHALTLSALTNLATLYDNQKRLVDAEALIRRVLAIQTEKLGLDHTDTMEPMFHLANVLSCGNNLAEAEVLYQSLLTRSQMGLGFNKYSVFARLGTLYQKQGKLVESEAMYLQAIAGYKTHLETDHPVLLQGRFNLGLSYHEADRLVEAEATIGQVLKEMKKVLGPDDAGTLKAMQVLGVVFKRQGKLAEAEAISQQALAGYRLLFGPEHKSTMRTFRTLAMCYLEQEKFAEAEALLLQELESFKHIAYDQRTSKHLDCINDLGYIYMKLGKLAEAEATFLKALSGYRRIFDPQHKSTLRTLRNLRICYQHQGKFAEAAALSPEDTDIERHRGHDPTANI